MSTCGVCLASDAGNCAATSSIRLSIRIGDCPASAPAIKSRRQLAHDRTTVSTPVASIGACLICQAFCRSGSARLIKKVPALPPQHQFSSAVGTPSGNRRPGLAARCAARRSRRHGEPACRHRGTSLCAWRRPATAQDGHPGSRARRIRMLPAPRTAAAAHRQPAPPSAAPGSMAALGQDHRLGAYRQRRMLRQRCRCGCGWS